MGDLLSVISGVERGLQAALLLVAGWPALRAAVSPPYWRAHRRPALVATVVVVGVGATAAALAVHGAHGVWALVTAAAAARSLAAWRARPSYGRTRRLPPGRLTLLPPVAVVEDERFLSRQAASYGPVFKLGGLRRPVVCIVGLARAQELLRRHDGDLVVPAMPFSRAIPKGFLRFMAPDDHTRYRHAIQRALTLELVEASRGSLQRSLAGGLAALAAAGARREGGIDPGPLLRSLTSEYLLDLVLGVCRGDARHTQVARCLRRIDHLAVSPLATRRARRLVADVGRACREGGSGRMSVLSACTRCEPALANDATLIGNLVFMVRAGGADLAGLLAWTLYLLAEHRQWLAWLRTEPEPLTAPSRMAVRIVKETLRLRQSEYVNRVARRPLEIEGFVVPAGWAIRVCVRESHRDASVFAQPQAFDPDRFRDGDPPRTLYAPFGMDRHACLGDHVTRTVAATFVDALARGYDLAVTRTAPAVMGRAHWEPGRRFRIRLAPLR